MKQLLITVALAAALTCTIQPKADAGVSLAVGGQTQDIPTLAPILKKVTPGVVNIAIKGRIALEQNPLFKDPFFRRFFDVPDLWYEGGVCHEGLNMIAERLGGERIAEADIQIEEIEQKVPFVQFGYVANFLLLIGILLWFWWQNGGKVTKEIAIVLLLLVLWGARLIPVGI